MLRGFFFSNFLSENVIFDYFVMTGEDMIECSECHSKISANNNNSKAVARAYDRHRSDVSSKARVLNLLLVGGDCIFVGLQVICFSFFLSFF
jgi:hypothetical protein